MLSQIRESNLSRLILYPIIAIIGATATGKTNLAFRLADFLKSEKGLESEFINADAFSLYKDLNIITAKPNAEEQKKYVFHQLNVLEVFEEANVSVYQREARKSITEIQNRGKLPILVGGSGLYINAALDNFEFPGTDPEIRNKYYSLLDEKGEDFIYNLLQEKDPESAKVIDKNNTRRIVRALEVIELTGKSFQAQLPNLEYFMPTFSFAIKMDLQTLEKAISIRTRQMLGEGLIEEVEALRDKAGVTAQKAIGFKQVCSFLDNEISSEELEAQISLATFQLAKRQLKWFKRDNRINWTDSKTDLEQIVHLLSTNCKLFN
ncbi:MAG: tRNA (adenosine(37)-N6)-dimethylallyltransferase MiaA [Bifidobacteriaceae bacterium]|jgi:tRNA dimethylallyltransferase|nr:tRNA (adenosine(37)-N6)-dimethylallyltransferase MiaA [Bifidobacteriaceae bacterium]